MKVSRSAAWLGRSALTLLLIELSLQGFYRVTAGAWLLRRTALPIFEPDQIRCYRLKPGLAFPHRTPEYAVTVYTNDQGLRTDRRRAPLQFERRENGVDRLLFLGPSYAFGWGNEYEDSYAALIGAGLQALGRRVEVVNLGTPAQTSAMQLCWLKEFGGRLRPDLVVQTVFGHPGLLDGDCPDQLVCPPIEDGYLVRRTHRWRRRLDELAKRSALLFYGWWVQRRYFGSPEDVAASTGLELPSEAVERFAGEPIESIAARYVDHLQSMRVYAGVEVKAAFVLVPPSFVVHAADLRRWPGTPPQRVDEMRALAARLEQDLRKRGIAFIDATPALRRAAQRERVYYWLDTHLNPAGNRVVAEAALQRLRELAGHAGAAGAADLDRVAR